MRSWEEDPRAWRSVNDVLPGSDTGRLVQSGRVSVDGVEVFVGVALIRATGQAVGKVEMNPSRVVDPHGCSLASVDQAHAALRLAHDQAGELVEWAGDLEDAKLRRADWARDFVDVENAPALIRSLAMLPKRWARRSAVYSDPSRNGAQTHLAGSGAGSCRLYDKHVETEGRAPAGTVRFEAECRSDWLARYGGMATVADLDEERVRRMAMNRWGWSAMGAEVNGTQRVVEKVERSGLSEREQAVFIGWLVMQASGRHWGTASRATLAKYRRVQRDLGIALSDLSTAGAGFSSRLDFESGREVVRVA